MHRVLVLLLLALTMGLASCQSSRTAMPRLAPDRSGSRWRVMAALPNARQEVGVAALEGKLYVLGGFSIMGAAITSTVEVYDPKLDSWSLSLPLPRPLHHVNAAAAGGRLFVVGALTGSDFAAHGDVLIFDPSKNRWTQGTPMPSGTERGASGVAVLGTRIYVAGGLRAGVSTTDFSLYDTVTDRWQVLPPLPLPRDHLVAGTARGLFYAISGRSDGRPTERVDAFDPRSGEWTSRAPILTARAGSSAATVGDRIFVMGGEGNPATKTGVFGENESYDAPSDRWDYHEPMRTARHGTGAAAIDGIIFVPGGADVQSFGTTELNEAFEP